MSGPGIHLIASYPKSGNTWVRCLIASLAEGGAPVRLADLGRLVPNAASRLWLEEQTDLPTDDLAAADFEWLRAASYRIAGRAFLKSHDCFRPQLFPADAIAGVVLVVRDPRDIVTSWADHMNLDPARTVALMADPDLVMARNVTKFSNQAPQRYGSWSSHTTSWLDDYPGPMLILRYEDMLSGPEAETVRLARFLELSHDTETVARSAEACAFAVLRASEERDGFEERQSGQKTFFRRGRVGAWREELAPALEAQVVQDHGTVMTRLGYLTSAA